MILLLDDDFSKLYGHFTQYNRLKSTPLMGSNRGRLARFAGHSLLAFSK